MKFSKIIYSVEDGVATILLNCEKNRNAFDARMIDELSEALELAGADDGVRCLLIASNGTAFSSGGDVFDMYEGVCHNTIDFKASFQQVASLTKKIKLMPKPVIAAVRGYAAGGGFMLALAADYTIAATDAKFTAAFVHIGLIPDCGGLFLMRNSLGLGRAVELAMTGRTVCADEAQRLGIAARVVPVEELLDEAKKQARSFAAGPKEAYAEMKALVYKHLFAGFDAYLDDEIESQLRCSASDDFKARVTGFVSQHAKAKSRVQ